MQRIRIIGKLHKSLEAPFNEALDFKTLNNNELIFFCCYSESNIPIGYCFTEIVRKDNTVLTCSILLRNVSQQFYKPFDEIPYGWKTISKFEFIEGSIPTEVHRLPSLDGWKEGDDYLFFQ